MAQAPHTLDLRPLPEMVNPFAQYAADLRAARYDDADKAKKAGELAKWLDFLASTPELGNVRTNSRLEITTYALAVAKADVRERMIGVLTWIEEYTARSQRQHAPQPQQAPANGGGFAIIE